MTISDLISFSGFSIGLFLCIVVLLRKEKKPADWYFFAYMLTTSLLLLACFVFFRFRISGPQLMVLYSGQLQMPLLFGYIFSLLKLKRIRFLDIGLWFPFMLSMLYMLVIFLVFPEDRINSIYQSGLLNGPLFFRVTLVLEILITPFVVVYLFTVSCRNRKEIKKRFSYTEGKDYIWIRIFLVLEFIIWVFSTVSYHIIAEVHSEWLDALFRLNISAISLLLYFMGAFGISKTGLFVLPVSRRERTPEPVKSPGKGSGFTFIEKEKADEIRGVLQELLERDRIYSDPFLSLQVLSEKSGFSTHMLSAYFSGIQETTFYDLINTFRVKEVRMKIDSGEAVNKTLLALALESGFNSKASFNRYFKKITGITPSHYLKSSQSAG